MVEKVNFVKRHTKARAPGRAERHHREGGADPPLERDALRRQGRSAARACGIRASAGRHARAHRRVVSGETIAEGRVAARRARRSDPEAPGSWGPRGRETPERKPWRTTRRRATRRGQAAARQGSRSRAPGARRPRRAKAASRAAAEAGRHGRPHARQKPRLAKLLPREGAPGADAEVRLHEPRCRRRGSRRSCINMGVGDAHPGRRSCSTPRSNELGADHRPDARRSARAKKSIANFKLREGVPIGCAVTLRGARMYEFYDRLHQRGGAAHPRLPRLRTRGRSTGAATTRWA